jgi:AGZA family xanthine/uracil permease-like MFS transporter
MNPLIQRAAEHFGFEELHTSWRTETLAGVTTFLTMSYIIFVNPSILRDAGMPATAVAVATCLSAALGSLMMGLYARYPIALAPGMGINAYFTYTVVLGMGVPWQTALGAVFISGVIFLILTFAGVQQAIVQAIPGDLHAAVAAGIGLFLALIGMQNAGIIVHHEVTMVSLGDLTRPSTLLALLGLLLMGALMAWRVQAAMVLGIVATTVAGIPLGLVHWDPSTYDWSDVGATALQLDIGAALSLGLLEIVFVFWFVDLFDNVGTLVAVGKKARLFRHETKIPRLGRILVTDGVAGTAGSLLGTSTVVSYIESAAGVAAGGRSGFTAAVTGVLFLLSLVVAPFVGAIPKAATAPALIVVGSLMLSAVRDIHWDDVTTAIPAFLTLTTIPLSYSIASGLAIGFISYTLLKVLHGEYRRISWLVYLLTILFLARFAYLGSAG